jgi:hypothetical protein
MTGRRWFVAALAVVALIALVAFARGREHHRGEEVGALARTPTAYVISGAV